MILYKKTFIFFLLALWMLGCSRNPPSTNTLNLHIDSDPITLDPALITDVRGGRLSSLLYDTLIQYNRHLKLRPCLAASWKTSKNGKIYTFTLRKNVVFSNGESFNAEDVVYSFERLAHIKTASPRSWILSHIQGFNDFRTGKEKHISGLRILDPYRLKIILNEPFAPFLALLTMPNASILSRKNDLNPHLSGSGPYILEHWQRDYELVFRSNPLYFIRAPKTSRIRFRIIKETLFASSEFRRGRLDIIEIPNTELPLYLNRKISKVRLLSQKNLSLYYLGFNCQSPPLDNRSIRRAISEAIDKDVFLETLRKHRSLPVNGPIPPGIPGYDTDLKNPIYQPYHAALLLRNFRSFFSKPLILLQSTNEETLEISEVIQSQLEKIGIPVKIIEQEWGSFKTRLSTGQFDLFLMSWWADYPDGENFLFPLFHSSNIGSGGNYTRLSDPQIDALIEKAQKTVSFKRRMRIYKTVQEKIVSEYPMVFLYSSKSVLALQPWVKGFFTHPLYNGNKYLDIEIKNRPDEPHE